MVRWDRNVPVSGGAVDSPPALSRRAGASSPGPPPHSAEESPSTRTPTATASRSATRAAVLTALYELVDDVAEQTGARRAAAGGEGRLGRRGRAWLPDAAWGLLVLDSGHLVGHVGVLIFVRHPRGGEKRRGRNIEEIEEHVRAGGTDGLPLGRSVEELDARRVRSHTVRYSPTTFRQQERSSPSVIAQKPCVYSLEVPSKNSTTQLDAEASPGTCIRPSCVVEQ